MLVDRPRRLTRRDFLKAGSLVLGDAVVPWLSGLHPARAADSNSPDRLPGQDRSDLFPLSGEIVAWPAGWSLPEVDADNPMTAEKMKAWMIDLDLRKTAGEIRTGHIRTYDQIKELMENPESWDYPTLTVAATISGGTFDPTLKYSWVDQDGGIFPAAYESADVLLAQSRDILKVIYEREPSEPQVMELYRTIQPQLMDLQGDLDSEVIYTSNTYTARAGTRLAQPDRLVCSMYRPGVGRGNEHFESSGGRSVFVLDNQAQFGFIFALAPQPLPLNDSRVAYARIVAPGGERLHLYARVLDFWSQPADARLGVSGVTSIRDQFPVGGPGPGPGPGWGSEVRPHCGLSIQEQPQQPSQPGGQPGNGVTPPGRESGKGDNPFGDPTDDPGEIEDKQDDTQDRGGTIDPGDDSTIPGQA